MLKKYQIFEYSIFGTILFHVPEHSKTKNVSRVDVLQLTEHMATWRGARRARGPDGEGTQTRFAGSATRLRLDANIEGCLMLLKNG